MAMRALLGVVAGGVVLAGAVPVQAGRYRTGLIPEDLNRVPWMVEVRSVPVRPGRPSADTLIEVDHSAEMPPVGDQSSQGSCVAWAVGYYHKTHTEWVEHGWDVTDPHQQFSPAFIYNQVNGGIDGGTSGSVAMRLTCEQGIASLADCHYNALDHLTWPSETAYCRALPFRDSVARFINIYDSSGLSRARQQLANGYTGILGIKVWDNFGDIQNYDYTYCSSERCGTMGGWHAVTIVGYNDTMTTSDGPGAFKLVNSWGEGWGLGGYGWMSYVAVMDTAMGSRQLEYAVDRVGYQPELIGRARITHPARDRVGIRLGLVPVESPLWSRDFRTWRWPGEDHPFPDHNIVFDLTDGAWLLGGGPEDSAFLAVIDDSLDGQTGTIDFFSVEHLERGTAGVSNETPVGIPDDGVQAVATASIPAGGVEEGANAEARSANWTATIVGNVLRLPEASGVKRQASSVLLDAAGRRVTELVPGENDVSRLGPGVYFVREGPRGQASQGPRVRKVVVSR